MVDLEDRKFFLLFNKLYFFGYMKFFLFDLYIVLIMRYILEYNFGDFEFLLIEFVVLG